MYLNSTYTELLEKMYSEKNSTKVREVAREMYLETALVFDLGYVQVPLIKKILERIVQNYGFKATLDGLRSTLSNLDASVSAEAAEKLNKIILIASGIIGFLTMLLMIFTASHTNLYLLIIPIILVISIYITSRHYRLINLR